MRQASNRTGMSLLEVIVSVTVVIILFSLLTPAVQTCRKVARRTQCVNRLRQLSIAVHNYSHLHGVLPPGCVNDSGPIEMVEDGYHMSWLVQILPFIDEEVSFHALDFREGAYADVNADVRKRKISALICPADFSPQGVPTSSYVGSTGGADEPISTNNKGLLFLNSSIRFREIRDGASYTILLGERLLSDSPLSVDLGWMSGTSSTLRSSTVPMPTTGAAAVPLTQQTGGFSSAHSVTHVALADGSVKALNGGMTLWQAYGNREDGSVSAEF